MSVNSKPLFTDFLYTWLGRLAKPTYPSTFFGCCERPNTALAWTQYATVNKHGFTVSILNTNNH